MKSSQFWKKFTKFEKMFANFNKSSFISKKPKSKKVAHCKRKRKMKNEQKKKGKRKIKMEKENKSGTKPLENTRKKEQEKGKKERRK